MDPVLITVTMMCRGQETIIPFGVVAGQRGSRKRKRAITGR